MDDKSDDGRTARKRNGRMVLPGYAPQTAEDFHEFRAHRSVEEIQVALDERYLAGEAATAARVYLLRLANKRAAESEKESREHEARAVAAAEVAARGSNKAALWTMIAAIVAAFGALVTAVAAFMPLIKK